MHGKNVCYVEFYHLNSAKKAVYNHKSYPLRLHDQSLYINYAVDVIQVGNPSNLLWVSGLDTSSKVDLEELKDMFEEFGEVENIILSASRLPVPISCFRTLTISLSDRQGLPTCIVRYSSSEDAEYAIKAHQKRRLRHHGLALQIRFSDSKSPTTRLPNPTLHVMGFSGNQKKLLSYISDYVDQVQDVYLSMCYALRLL